MDITSLVMFSVCCVFACLGNTTTLTVYWVYRTARTVSTTLLAHLAFVDLVVGATVIFPCLIGYVPQCLKCTCYGAIVYSDSNLVCRLIDSTWFSEDLALLERHPVYCTIVGYFSLLATNLSYIILCFIALDACLLLHYPFRYK